MNDEQINELHNLEKYIRQVVTLASIILCLPTSIFYAQGVKANVLFF